MTTTRQLALLSAVLAGSIAGGGAAQADLLVDIREVQQRQVTEAPSAGRGQRVVQPRDLRQEIEWVQAQAEPLGTGPRTRDTGGRQPDILAEMQRVQANSYTR